jgi:non-specific serine/threonine protein kinase
MGQAVAGSELAGLHGFAKSLTSFVGRVREVEEVAALLGECRLITVAGPGGVGKTRLAAEVAARVAGRFADGVWLVELGSVPEPALLEAAVATALGLRQAPGASLLDSMAAVLAQRQVLLVLDNCEHLLAAAAHLCGRLLLAADDMRVLVTSREPLGIGGEARYRLAPLGLPGPGDLGGAGGSEALTLFADRARRADPRFVLDSESAPAVARLVRRLDGMPLAIELAAARVEALGMGQLVELLADQFELLAEGDRLAPARHGSLAAAIDWSYRLLTANDQGLFRRLAVFPGPFTLESAEAVAGPGAAAGVLHLVDCSLLNPPSAGADGRARYLMLETLRTFAAERLAEENVRDVAEAALAAYATRIAEQAAAGLASSASEAAAARLLDAEEATVHQALAWALDHDPDTALRLATALAPWWDLRGRDAAGYQLLHRACDQALAGGQPWCAAQVWLGHLAVDFRVALAHFSAVRDVLATGAPSALLARALASRARCLMNLDQIPEAAAEARHALALAKDLGDLAGQTYALHVITAAALYARDFDDALAWARQSQRIDPAAIPGALARKCMTTLADTLQDAGEPAAAQEICGQVLASAREVGDRYAEAQGMGILAQIHMRANDDPAAAVCLRESLRLAGAIAATGVLLDCLNLCGHLCARAGRWADALTAWAAHAAYLSVTGMTDLPEQIEGRRELLGQAREALEPAGTRAAEERGTAMTLSTAVEFATLAASTDPPGPAPAAGLPQLSARERELVTLVAHGLTDAQIAEQLYISVRTVGSHMDRIRDKTGCRRRADLTRLALQASLV